jgi:hypothetical protein
MAVARGISLEFSLSLNLEFLPGSRGWASMMYGFNKVSQLLKSCNTVS